MRQAKSGRRSKVTAETAVLASETESAQTSTADAETDAFAGAVQVAQMCAVSKLATSIAHDLRNILTAMHLERGEMAPADYQARAFRQMDRLYVLTHSLLALAEEPDVPAVPVNISEVVDFVFRLLNTQAEMDGVSLHRHMPPEPVFALGNPRRLEHLLVVLLLNALNALAETGGEIRVHAQRVAGRVRVEVYDNGPGIAPEHLPRLFEPFFTTHANHVGLGLFSARRIVEACGGEIMAASPSGAGTTFTVWLAEADGLL